MRKKAIFVVLIIIAIIIVVGIIVLANTLGTSNGVQKTEIEQKAYEIFGDDYCTIDHSLVGFGGEALTEWECKLCGRTATNSDTDTPVICSNCARITGRCMYCGKLGGEI